MTPTPLAISSFQIMIFILVQTLIAITNAILMKRLDKFPKVASNLKVSVLIPARNEEQTIENCVDSILKQNYHNFEVIVLNDNSTDNTESILTAIKSEKLRVVRGLPLAQDWLGKSWACQQLAELATGDLLLFTDADTIYQPETLTYAVSAQEKTKADLITAVTKNEVKTFGEKITVPFIVWSIFTILPLAVAYLLPRSRAFCAANGKFILLRKEFYKRIGGHRLIKNNAIEDIALAKLVKAHCGKWRLFDASNLISARMYYSLSEAVQGFTKNYFALFGYKILIALFVWFWIGLITYQPLVRIVISLLQNNYSSVFYFSLVSILATCMQWLLMSIKFKFPTTQFLFYPLTIAVSIFIGLRSMILTIAHRTVWKGRRLKSAKIRWL